MEETNTTVITDPQAYEVSVYPRLSELEFPDVELIMAALDAQPAQPEEADFALELDYFDDQKQEDKLWQARTGLNEDTLCGAIETIIFMSDRPVPLTRIKTLIDEDLPLRVVHESLERLQTEYENKHHGLRLVEVAEGYQYRTKATYSRFVQDLFKVNSLVLSPTALEVLAIIAYRQPVSKTDIDKIRGVDSSHIVRGLMDKRLVKVTGRSEELGRPTLYGTTPEFLEVFNLADLSQLPPEYDLKEMATQSIGKISDIKTLVHTDDKGRFIFDEIDELDELSETIKGIAADTDFTLSLKVEEKKRTGEDGAEVKTAFDLLEEFVNNNVVLKQNLKAVLSNLPVAGVEPQVISDLEAGPFNIPREDEEEEFEMIDLDTGMPIRFDDEPESESVQAQDLDQDQEIFSLEEEREALSQALDEAFERLTQSALSDDSEEDANDHSNLLDKEDSLDELTAQMLDQAKELDLDLDFLQNDEKTTRFDSDFDDSLTDEGRTE